VSHVSDLVGETGCVYAVEFSHRSGRDLINVAKKRTNVIPIIEDARHPHKCAAPAPRTPAAAAHGPFRRTRPRAPHHPRIRTPILHPLTLSALSARRCRYRMLIGMVDCVFADVAQPDQARIVALNSHMFLKNQGHTVISVKANCIDSTAPAEHVFAAEVNKLKLEQFKPLEQLTLEPYERDHCVVIACYRDPNFDGGKSKKQKTSD